MHPRFREMLEKVMQPDEAANETLGALAGGGPPPQDGSMDVRVAKIESIIPTLATKADVEGVRGDLHKMDASITRWMIATVIALFLGFAGLFFTMSSTINSALERAVKPAAVQPASPLIIQLPAQPQPQVPVETPPQAAKP